MMLPPADEAYRERITSYICSSFGIQREQINDDYWVARNIKPRFRSAVCSESGYFKASHIADGSAKGDTQLNDKASRVDRNSNNNMQRLNSGANLNFGVAVIISDLSSILSASSNPLVHLVWLLMIICHTLMSAFIICMRFVSYLVSKEVRDISQFPAPDCATNYSITVQLRTPVCLGTC